jgi:hypothetical protein
MQVKLILPALTEATSPLLRPIEYSLLPPLGLATLSGLGRVRPTPGPAGPDRRQANCSSSPGSSSRASSSA